MNFLTTGRMSLGSVAENIMTCFSRGVAKKICCTSARMSVTGLEDKIEITGQRHTDLLEHLVALVNDEVLDLAQLEVARLDQRQETAGCAHNDVLLTQ